jgi:late competence protein required for DNA uptake (superfamily II DNA/RNA helicase)
MKNFTNKNSTLYDRDNKPVLCKCGNKASGAVIGREAYMAWCRKCNPMGKTIEAKFIYRPHQKDKDD